jgi:hypothetical protein
MHHGHMHRVHRRRAVAVATLVVVLIVLALRLEQVHDDTWEWRLTYAKTPPKLHVFDRDYRRSDTALAPPEDTRYLVTVPGGARVYSKRIRPYAPTVIWAVPDAGTAVYSLMGGP